ncbi:301_t:CDS:2, partial [Racocetra fulgida]
MEYTPEFDAVDYADDQEACLEELFNHFDQFVEQLQDNNNIDTDKLPASAVLIKRDKNPLRGKPVEGIEYSVLINTDFHKWIQKFGKSTGATYVRHIIERNQGNVILRVTYKCHHTGTYQSTAVIEDVRRSERAFEAGNWISDNQNMKFQTNE